MSKAEGRKITLKFTQDIMNPLPDVVSPGPVISGYAISTTQSSISIITIPAEAQVGDLLILFFSKDDDPSESVASGWTRILSESDGSVQRVALHYKFYEGESKTFTLIHDSEETASIVICIPGGQEPVTAGSVYQSYTKNHYPPNLVSGFEEGTETLWIAFSGSDNYYMTAQPSNFPDNFIVASRSGVGVAIATKTSTNASENPSYFMAYSSCSGRTATVAVKVRKIKDLYSDEVNKGFTVTGQRETYEGSGVYENQTYPVSRCYRHDTLDAKHLSLVFNQYPTFKNVVGDITIDYDQSLGVLYGVDGLVTSFTEVFTPTDLVPAPNPNPKEKITLGFDTSITRNEITYKSSYAPVERITLGLSASITRTEVEEENP